MVTDTITDADLNYFESSMSFILTATTNRLFILTIGLCCLPQIGLVFLTYG